MVTVILDSSVDAFLSHAEAALTRSEAENSLILGLCNAVRRGRYTKFPPILARIVDNRGRLLTVALRTPPHNLILSPCEDVHVWPLLASALSDASVIAAGVLGPTPEVMQFADVWRDQTGLGYRVGRGSRIHRLEKVQWPSMPSGEMKRATRAQLPLVLDWTEKFIRESIPDEVIPMADLLKDAERRLETGEIFMWIADDGPTCMSYYTGPTPNGIRISGVYTPEPKRRRGFASALVANLSQHLLDEGRRLCFLYTDADNPTSNRIYRRIGYHHVCDCSHVLFET